MADTTTPEQRELRLLQIGQLYCRGVVQTEIAKQVGVTQQQVSYDLKIVHHRWLKQFNLDIPEAKARELAKIDHLEAEAWAAFERSKLPREEKSGNQTEMDDGKFVNGKVLPFKKVTRRTNIRTRERDGAAIWLEQVRWCIERRCAIFGLDAPTKIAWQTLVDDEAAKLAAVSGLEKQDMVTLAQEWLAEKH